MQNTLTASRVISRGLGLGLAFIWLVIAGVPFYFMAITGFKGQFELFSGGSVFAFPRQFNYDSRCCSTAHSSPIWATAS